MTGKAVNPYGTQRTWDKDRSTFPSIKGREAVLKRSLLNFERQVAMAQKHPELADVALAYAVCGMNVPAFFEGSESPVLTGFPPHVEELARNCLATFHPEYNPEVAELGQEAWKTPADIELVDFRSLGWTA